MSSSAPKRQRVVAALPFSYTEAHVLSADAASVADGGKTPEAQTREEGILRLRAESFEQGRQSGLQQMRPELDAALGQQRNEITKVLAAFVIERQSYYRRIETEVVQLALAIARKVLHREVQIDPQALAGMVRITLEKLDSGTRVKLRVHPKEAGDWRHYFACQADDVPAPDVFEDAAVAVGECHIETSQGSTEAGLESQLKEIETGLLDLLAERPGVEHTR
jgi:flagellar assembly protein FliH